MTDFCCDCHENIFDLNEFLPSATHVPMPVTPPKCKARPIYHSKADWQPLVLSNGSSWLTNKISLLVGAVKCMWEL
jgi:hypothetical protein